MGGSALVQVAADTGPCGAEGAERPGVNCLGGNRNNLDHMMPANSKSELERTRSNTTQMKQKNMLQVEVGARAVLQLGGGEVGMAGMRASASADGGGVGVFGVAFNYAFGPHA